MRKWNNRELQIEYAQADDDRVATALWEENSTPETHRLETVIDRAEFAELLRKGGKE